MDTAVARWRAESAWRWARWRLPFLVRWHARHGLARPPGTPGGDLPPVPAAAWVTVGGTRLRVARVDVTAGMIVVHAQAPGPLAGVTGPARLYDGAGRLVYGGWSIGEVYAVTGGAMLTVTLPMQIS